MPLTSSAPVLIVGGSGLVGSLAAGLLRRFQPRLPIAIGGRDLARAAAVAETLGNAQALQVDLQRRDLGVPAGVPFSAVVVFVKDDTLNHARASRRTVAFPTSVSPAARSRSRRSRAVHPAAGGGAGALRRGRCGADPQRASDRPYEAAALCPRQGRHGRARARRVRAARQQRPWPRREPAMALHRALRRARAVGQGGRPTLTVSVDAWEPYLERA